MQSMPWQHELDSFWQFAFERPRELRGRKFSSSFNALADVEAFLWVHYGVELGVYAKNEAEKIYGPVRAALINAVEQVKKSTIVNCFPQRLVTFLDKTALKDSIFEAHYADRLDVRLTNPVVTTLLFHEVARACNNPLISNFSDVLTFGENAEWSTMLKRSVDVAAVLSGAGSGYR
jgi:hypothetical protein